jgi:hypothetical protein
MDHPVDHYWRLRLQEVRENLEKNRFEAHVVADRDQAKQLVLEKMLPDCAPRTISWGGSWTFTASGLYKALRSGDICEVIDTYDKSITPDQLLERRRRALLADLFFTGSNAITENGQLVNLDMIGNRVAALTFGPKWVVVLAGRNKIEADLERAMERIKRYAAPANVLKLDKKTPCAKTGKCHDCSSPDRICNHWTITEKSFPGNRIKVVLINQDLGL